MNLDEYVLGLLASTPDHYPWNVVREAPTVTIQAPSLGGRIYRVWFSHDLLTWLPASADLPGTGGVIPWTDTGSATGGLPSNAAKRFYRVKVTVP